MARGLNVCLQTRVTSTFLAKPICKKILYLSDKHKRLYVAHYHPSARFFCKCSLAHDQQQPIDMSKYKDSFSKRMALAGLKPHHRIALGVSGGPDSMALCVLTTNWKIEGLLDGVNQTGGFVDGLLAIIVDHGLRAESKQEANIVSSRVSRMGIRCETVRCDWPEGRPKQGHLQEAARDMRYQIFQDICIQNQIGVLLIAHHSDDQAELFIIRLSRNSGVLGLAGMAFTSQIFSSRPHSYSESSKNHSILLVRPLLDFAKEDMYKICQGGNQDFVEDPSNRSPLFARNRIRMSLGNISSCIFKSELQALISACRKTRSYVDHICRNLIRQAVTITNEGYAIIDLETLNPSNTEDICLSKFIALVLQFISQRHRPVRGGASKLLLDYIRTCPCKNSLTAAGCYLCPAPGSKGTKALVCCSVDCPLSSKVELFYKHSSEGLQHSIASELEQIKLDGKSYSDNLVSNASDVCFLNEASESVLSKAKRLNIISDSTYSNILLLQEEEIKHFKPNYDTTSDHESKNEVESVSTSLKERLRPGQLYYFMNRFFVTWRMHKEIFRNQFTVEDCCGWDLGGESWHCHCSGCVVGSEMVAEVRHMIESDWLYLAKLSQCSTSENVQQQRARFASETTELMDKTDACLDYVRLSAQRALRMLKIIPVAARRSLPVFVNCQGMLLSVPSINFKHCPCLTVSAVFKPRVPLEGGHSSFV
ncbi:ATP_bind_3 domain-containing protein, partial [Cephalotus follicularis]